MPGKPSRANYFAERHAQRQYDAEYRAYRVKIMQAWRARKKLEAKK